jgi:hypothetical protein
MTVLTGSTITIGVTSGGGLREDLEDTIWDLFPEDTWAVSNLDKTEATATGHEWLAQQLAAAAANIGVEGDDATFTSLTSPARFGNYCQIMSKTFLVSDTLEAVKKAGRSSEVARGAMVKMRELKRDLEFTILQNQAASAGGATTGRAMGGMEMWLSGYNANVAVNTTVTASTAHRSTTTAQTCTTVPITSGFPGATAPTDGSTTAALTATNVNFALQAAWSNGGNPTVILATANNKTLIDSFTSVATRTVNIDVEQAPIIGAANVYISDFGRHTVILNRYGRNSVLLCIDPNYWALAFLRQPQARQLAKTGDGTKYQIITEATLVCRNQQASAKVVALT